MNTNYISSLQFAGIGPDTLIMRYFSVTFLKKSLRKLLLGVALFFSFSCSLTAEIFDISDVQLSFESPAKNSFTNKTSYPFRVQFLSNNPEITSEKAVLEVYAEENCDETKKIDTRPLQADSFEASAGDLEDGKKYSARVLVQNKGNIYRSQCSPWVGVDLQNPESVTVEYPENNNYISSKQFLASWSASVDRGISGLRDEPYRVRLFGEPYCAGPALQTVDSQVEQFTFKNLTHGVSYSVEISAVDNAGNESTLSCSPYTEIDIYAPGFRLEDPSSAEGYSRTISTLIEIQNDAQAGYWCITADPQFIPSGPGDACPGGAGGANGWYTQRPLTLPLSSGDGLKTYFIWLLRGDGTLISNKQTSAAIRLDQTPPGAFNVVGIGGGDDEVFDAWLSSVSQVQVKWQASADAVDYDLEIRAIDAALICRQQAIPGNLHSFTFSLGQCAPLLNGQNYEVRMTSFDAARNPTTTNFSFEVDLEPPATFSILGIAGGSDLNIDSFFGGGLPTLYFENSLGASHYEVEVRDLNGIPACTLGVKAAPSSSFNYATEGGASCLLLHGGFYQALVTALDEGKNRTPASNNLFQFQVDLQAPELIIDSGPDAITSHISDSLAFHAFDSMSGIQETRCALDGGIKTSCTSPQVLSGLSEGPHQFEVVAIDFAGNQSTETYSWWIDLTGPVTTVLSGPSGSQSADTASFVFSATDVGPAGVSGFECSLNGSVFTPCSSPASYSSLPEGIQSWRVRAVDQLGNVGAVVTRSFLTDYSIPLLTITSAPSHPTDHNTSGSLAFSVSDAGSGIQSVQCSIDGSTFVNCSSPFSYSGLVAGMHTVVVRATDNTGHITSVSHTWMLYTYTWANGSWSTCSASQPVWQTGSFGTCSVAQPAYSYSGWGACSKTCGGGVRSRTQSCSVVTGTQTRSVTCPVSTGLQNRSVTCLRNDGTSVADVKCLTAKPNESQACSRNDCAASAPPSSQACSRGGGTDCHSAQATSESCNTQSCCTGASIGGYCWHMGAAGQSCATVCASRGGYNDATRTYAGSSGTLSACNTVLATLGIVANAATDNPNCNSGAEHAGCVSGTLLGVSRRRCINGTTNATASHEFTRRACACNN